MVVKQVDETSQKVEWGQYFLIGTGILLTVLLIGAVVYFWEEMQDLQSLAYGYGYVGAFLVSIFGGITIIPLPSLLAIFTLGHVLNPVYVGLVAGLGEALGGITIYLTGAGGGAVWSKLRSRQQELQNQPRPSYDIVTPVESKLRSKWQLLYDHLTGSRWKNGTSWSIFITSAFVWGLYYPVVLAAGTLGIGLKRCFLISWAGKTIRGLIVALAGYWGLRFLLQWIVG